ncbi:MAG: hypothetical protein RR550_01710, partial [Rikenellaceae bacterium]
MNKFLLILFLGVPLLTLGQEKRVKLNLEEAVNYALKKNFNQQSLEIDKQIEQAVLDQSKLEVLPDLNGNLSQDFANSKTTKNAWSG